MTKKRLLFYRSMKIGTACNVCLCEDCCRIAPERRKLRAERHAAVRRSMAAGGEIWNDGKDNEK
jgi:hypothetical protein